MAAIFKYFKTGTFKVTGQKTLFDFNHFDRSGSAIFHN